MDALTVKRHKEGVIVDSSPHRGLRFVGNRNGTKTWIYRYRDADGKLKQIKLGDYPGMGLAEARAAYIEQKLIKSQHGDPRSHRKSILTERKEKLRKESADAYSVSQMVEHYLIEHIADRRTERGSLESRRMLEFDVTPHMGSLPVHTVRRSHVHDLIQRIAARAPRIADMVKVELKGGF